ncbi:hypothetical protein [Kutzneria sp. CA-103260]|uniref:hypothetical protein n=1 Tax=Kutzneria sp. CA-103260 TaxID=2802641 RepID=UPI001BABD753|nr:hypothetical protein [Kutzneria sp. CA-103260]QUQ64786.1 hypothetical protein JJ691_25070 [Kutzneria sp. CA-103260]
MSPADDTHNDHDNQRSARPPTGRRPTHDELANETRRLLAEFDAGRGRIAVAFARTEEAIERVHRTWDAGVRDAITRLDQIQVQVSDAVRLATVLADQRQRRPAP